MIINAFYPSMQIPIQFLFPYQVSCGQLFTGCIRFYTKIVPTNVLNKQQFSEIEVLHIYRSLTFKSPYIKFVFSHNFSNNTEIFLVLVLPQARYQNHLKCNKLLIKRDKYISFLYLNRIKTVQKIHVLSICLDETVKRKIFEENYYYALLFTKVFKIVCTT